MIPWSFGSAWTIAGCYFQPQAQHENNPTAVEPGSNCRGIDREKAVINPGLLHTGHSHIPTVNGHVHPYTIRFTDGLAEAMGDKVTCLRSQQQGLGLGTGGT